MTLVDRQGIYRKVYMKPYKLSKQQRQVDKACVLINKAMHKAKTDFTRRLFAEQVCMFVQQYK